MKKRLLISLITAVLLSTTGCSPAPKKPFDVKGEWEAIKGECGSYCRFVIMPLDEKQPDTLYIVFPAQKKGEDARGYVLEHVEGEEWAFDYIAGKGSLFLKDEHFVSLADITYQKVTERNTRETTP